MERDALLRPTNFAFFAEGNIGAGVFIEDDVLCVAEVESLKVTGHFRITGHGIFEV